MDHKREDRIPPITRVKGVGRKQQQVISVTAPHLDHRNISVL